MPERRLALTRDGQMSFCSSNSENIGKKRCNHIAHQGIHETTNEFMDRTSNYFNIEKYTNKKVLNKAKSNKIINASHNAKAYLETKNALDKYGCCAIVQATGTGKSSIFTSIADDYNDEKCVLVAPLNGIKEQFLEHNKENNVNLNDNLYVLSYQDIEKKVKEDRLSEYDNLGIKGNVRLLMLDELHRSGAKEWSDSLKKFINYCKKDEDFKILGASATPEREDGSDPSMEFCKGIKVSNLSLEEAIEKDILPMPNYVGISIYREEDFTNIKNKIIEDKIIDRFSKKRCITFIEEKQSKYNNSAYFDKVEDLIQKNLQSKIIINENKCIGTKILVFCENIKDAENGFGKEIEEKLKKIFPNQNIKASIYVSKIKDQKQKEFYQTFIKRDRDVKKGDIEVLLTVNKFNEGIHAPNVEIAFMGRKTKSKIIYLQQIGRVLSSNDEAGFPLIFDFAGNFKNALLKGIDFKEMEKRKNERTKMEYHNAIVYKNYINTDESEAYLNDLDEIKAYMEHEKYGNFKAGLYKGKYATLKSISKGKKIDGWKLNNFKAAIEKGDTFEKAINKHIYF